MKVLLVGSGAREHALAWKIKKSKLLSKLYLYGANDGFKNLGENLEAEDFDSLVKISKERGINLVVVGPEEPLVDGIVDVFKKYEIEVIGVDKNWARLESSKSFAKAFMQKHNIPTSRYEIIENESEIETVLKSFSSPYVIKADGLAKGKGVSIVTSIEEAKKIIIEYLKGKFDTASKKVLVEEYQEGEELSLIAFYDGKTLLSMVAAKDYKRLLDNDEGPNTGGMGAYCPVKLDERQKLEIENYIKKLENALNSEKADFSGIIYSGLIFSEEGLKVLEYNVRFGDPEVQALLMQLKTDILDVFDKMTKQKLDEIKLEYEEGYSVCVVLAAEGYPENPKKGDKITIPDTNCQIFFSGLKKTGGDFYSDGGRVLSVCKMDKNPLDDIYKTIDEIKFEKKLYRKDVAADIRN